MKRMTYSQYYNKVYGGWIGKCIGGASGARQEGNKSFMHYTRENLYPDTVPPNDDLDLQILYLQEVLGKKGSKITKYDLGEAFANYNLCICNEYSVAIRNISSRIMPPYSGSYNNNFFAHSMGCPIRSELWGYICPGNPEVAIKYAEMDGCIDHTDESIYGEQFLSAMASEAFFEDDIEKLIAIGLKFIPDNSIIHSCICYASDLFKSNIDWRMAREKIVASFGSADATYSIVNIGIIIIALLYGKGDFTQTIIMAINSGYDTDCTAATSCALIGQIIGALNIDDFWLDKVGDKIVIGTVDITRESDSIKDLASETCAAGLSLIRDGVIDIEITDIPSNVTPSLPSPAKPDDIELSVEYKGIPAVGQHFNAIVDAVIANTGEHTVSGNLVLRPAEALSADNECTKITLRAGEILKIPYILCIKNNIEKLPVKNISNLAFDDKYSCEFGLFGAISMKMLGPYFDTYDTGKFDRDPYNELQQKLDGRVDLYAIFNGFVNIEKEYIDESFKHIDQIEGINVEFPEEVIYPDKYIGYKGPCCVYLIYDFYSPEGDEKASMDIGNNCEYKLWLNNEYISSGGIDMYMPFNNGSIIKLKKGSNRMIIKLLRRNTEIKFSYYLRDSKNRYRYNNSYSSMLEESIYVYK